MSTKSSFREALEQRVETAGVPPSSSGSGVDVLLRLNDEMRNPVAIARLLSESGVTLRRSHVVIDVLAAQGSYAIRLKTDDLQGLKKRLEGLGVSTSEIRRPSVSAKAVRDVHHLSQLEFATRFGLEVRTIQNWEQGRHSLDAAATILLALIKECPDAVERILTAGSRGRPTDAPNEPRIVEEG